MKLLIILLAITTANAKAPQKKIRLQTKSEKISLISARLAELEYKVANPSKEPSMWFIEAERDSLRTELIYITTHK